MRGAAAGVRGYAPGGSEPSPLQRARTEAEAIEGPTGLARRIVDELREMNYGRWEGQKFLEVRKADEAIYRRWIDEPEFPCPEGESHNDVLKRIRNALSVVTNGLGVATREAGVVASALARHAAEEPPATPKRPVVVTHGTAIRIAITALLDLPLSASRHFAQDNAALNVFVRSRDRWVLKLWNDTTHCEQS